MCVLYPNHWASADSRADKSWAVCLSLVSWDSSAQVWRGRNLCTLFFVLLRAGVNHPEPSKYTLAFVNKDIPQWSSLSRVEP